MVKQKPKLGGVNRAIKRLTELKFRGSKSRRSCPVKEEGATRFWTCSTRAESRVWQKGRRCKQTPDYTAKLERAKLPKSTITKFNGTYEAWLPFWNKFIAEDASVDLLTATKFAYLKQLIEAKVRVGIWELTKRRFWLDYALGFRDMAIRDLPTSRQSRQR